jgi:mitochondrial fission protein ELM1
VDKSGDISKIPLTVISDGKPGHENQSLGIAEHIQDSDILLLRHHLKESLPEFILRLQIRLSGKWMKDPHPLLDRIFAQEEIQHLVSHHPRAIIAAGTLSAVPCLLAGALTGAKTCICMKPSMLSLSMFDLAVVPEHDDPPDATNILRTIAAPNRVSSKRLADEWEAWKSEMPDNGNVISWVIGGPSASAGFDESRVLYALHKSLEWAEKNNVKVWLSTARRTPESLEDSISKLSDSRRALTWTLLWHRDHRNPLYAMFQKSKLAIVTSDSVSMIAEAASAGVGPIVFRAGEKGAVTKQDRMVDNLMSAGYGALADNADELISTLSDMLRWNEELPRLDDTVKAADRLLRLINQ